METIRNYLETMFAKLPNTLEVQKAKNELWQMMEDKYTELIREGRTENEAIGIVISEFGNLDELAEDLGIKNVVKYGSTLQTRMLSMDEVKTYLRDKTRSGYMIALGTFLCITSVCGFFGNGGWHLWWHRGTIGTMILFTFVAIAVGLFVFANVSMGKWYFLKNQVCSIDFATAEYVHNQRENFRITYSMMITIGVILCVICAMPVVVFDAVFSWGHGIGLTMMFVFIGIGVFLFVAAGNRNAGFKTILSLNKQDTMGGAFISSQKQVQYNNTSVAQFMSSYWTIVTCIYLCVSFVTYHWHTTWIIWVIAALLEKVIKNNFQNRE